MWGVGKWVVCLVGYGFPLVKLNEGSGASVDPSAQTVDNQRYWSAFKSLGGWTPFGTIDYNLDGTQDLLLYQESSGTTQVKVVCRQPDNHPWSVCGSFRLPLAHSLFLRPLQIDTNTKGVNGKGVARHNVNAGGPSAVQIVTISSKTDAGPSPSGIGKAVGNVVGNVVGNDDKSSCVLQSFVLNERDLGKKDFVSSWSESIDCETKPIFLDIDFDGLTDMLGSSEASRAGYINLGNGSFEKRGWEDMSDYFDLTNYSNRDRFPVDLYSFEDDKSNEDFLSSIDSAVGHNSSVSDSKGFFGWLRSFVEEPSAENTVKHYLKEHLEDFKKHMVGLYSQTGNGQWTPRPLPLHYPARIAHSVSGHAQVDMDGDCMADLVLIVDSPDFESRQELEIWLTEPNANGAGAVRRMWRSQRLLLPDNLLSVYLTDFNGSGGADLLVLAGLQPRLYLFRMLHESQELPGGLCGNSFHFSFGGMNGRVQSDFMTVTPIAEELVTKHLQVLDVDGDRYDDVVTIVQKPAGRRSVRVYRSVPWGGGSDRGSDRGGAQNASGGWFAGPWFGGRASWFGDWWLRLWWAGSSAAPSSVNRAFESYYELDLRDNPVIASGWLDSGHFLVWHGAPGNPLTAFAQTGFDGEMGYATRVQVYGAQCLGRKAALPLSGAVVALAPPGMDGVRLPVRRTLSTADSASPFPPAVLTAGFGQSSNYIDVANVGLPYTHAPLHECGEYQRLPIIANATRPALAAFARTWTAVMPNCQLLITVPANRWKTDLWRLSLILSPGRQAAKVFVGMLLALALVGLFIGTHTQDTKRRAKQAFI
ncbi:putative transmembrane protein [Gregarina niphandrodes]|uniref:Transmembrane protein n=1 Tax=Gregarina niphandrodes TaxID=110365 RepID=A0A023B176_GRENI|nr:putative transmembrane protein [Gregarina niphandrodes]EZG46263.1 putative transmembrane protein [Gregarina niphandrodes]|eukprot:XP_011132333.1 putative transmembrane protein [Gregarina niphandrodes]